MSKLQRVVDGQSLAFLVPPRIFHTLSADLPSGSITFANGEKAYWRLQRNVSEMNRLEKSTRALAETLAEALVALTSTAAFRNHYGLTASPALTASGALTETFRNLLVTNSARVEYSSITHGVKKNLVENIVIPFGNQVVLRATRGNRPGKEMVPPKAKGVRGKFWLSDADGEDKAFTFFLFSPIVNLTEYISADRLKVEILNKIKNNLGIMSAKATVVFDDGQFNPEEQLSKGLSALVSQHPAPKNGANKKKGDKVQNSTSFGSHVTAVVETKALHRDAYAELTQDEKDAYLEMITGLATSTKPEDVSTIRAFLLSGIMEDALTIFNDKRNAAQAMTLPFFLATAIGISAKKFEELLGDEPMVQPRVKAVAGEKYTVVDGDTLSAIALEAYGNAEDYQRILDENAFISNPDLIYPGWILVLPSIDGTLDEGDEELDDVDLHEDAVESVVVEVGGNTVEIHAESVTIVTGGQHDSRSKEQLLEDCKKMLTDWEISDQAQRQFYIYSLTLLCANNDPTHDEFFKKIILSNILADEWKAWAKVEKERGGKSVAHTFWLSQLIQMDEARYYTLLGISKEQAEAMQTVNEEEHGKLDLSGYDPTAVMKELEVQNSQAMRVYKIDLPVSESSDLRIDEQPNELIGSTTYTVVEGDTIESIAKAFFGDAGAVTTIVNANKEKLLFESTDLVPGTVLSIPSISADDDVGPDTVVLSTTVSSFLETHDPANFVEGTRAILTAPDGAVTTLQQYGGSWLRVETVGGKEVVIGDNKA